MSSWAAPILSSAWWNRCFYAGRRRQHAGCERQVATSRLAGRHNPLDISLPYRQRFPGRDTNATTTANTPNGGESRLICSLLITYRFWLKYSIVKTLQQRTLQEDVTARTRRALALATPRVPWQRPLRAFRAGRWGRGGYLRRWT